MDLTPNNPWIWAAVAIVVALIQARVWFSKDTVAKSSQNTAGRITVAVLCSAGWTVAYGIMFFFGSSNNLISPVLQALIVGAIGGIASGLSLSAGASMTWSQVFALTFVWALAWLLLYAPPLANALGFHNEFTSSPLLGLLMMLVIGGAGTGLIICESIVAHYRYRWSDVVVIASFWVLGFLLGSVAYGGWITLIGYTEQSSQNTSIDLVSYLLPEVVFGFVGGLGTMSWISKHT